MYREREMYILVILIIVLTIITIITKINHVLLATSSCRSRRGWTPNFARQDFDVLLRDVCGSFAENRGDLWRLAFSYVKLQTGIAQIYGDEESLQKAQEDVNILARKIP